jgi:tetratricopeptide (TPR) repeat protein
MISHCPQCKIKLSDFAVSCEKCGWSIVASSGSSDTFSFTQPEGEQDKRPEDFIDVKNSPPEHAASTVANVAGAAQTRGKKLSKSETEKQARSLEQTELHLNKAMARIEIGEFEKAIRSLNRSIIASPYSRLGECYSLRGYCHLKSGDFKRSENDCTEAIRLNWNDAQTYAWRAAARGEQNKWRLAFDDLDRACTVAGRDRDTYLGLMDAYAESASEHFRNLIKAGDQSADIFFERGWVYYRSGKYDKAERDFKQALSVQENHPWASAGMAELIFSNKSPSGKYSPARTVEVFQLCNNAMLGSSGCKRNALPIRAQIYRFKGDLDRALADLNELSELSANDPELTVLCCRLRVDAGDYMVAIDELTKLLNENPALQSALLLRGNCYREIRNYALAVEDYSKFLRGNPDDPEALVRRAEVELATGHLDPALRDLDAALARDETSFEAFLCRAKVYLKQKRLDLAMTECQKAARLDNSGADVFATLAAICYQLGQYTQSIEEYSRAVELADEHSVKAGYLYLRGTAYYELGDFQKAYTDFKHACHIRPNHAGSWIWKAAACSRLEKWSGAILGLQQAIATRPSSQAQYRQLGTPVAERAIEHFDRQQQRGKSTADLFRHRGLAFQFLGKYTRAIEDFSNSLKLDSKHVETFIRRGQAYETLGKSEEAIKDFHRAIKLDRGNHQAYYHLSSAKNTSKDLDGAIKDIRKAIKNGPQHPRYYIFYAELMQKKGDYASVVAALDRATLLDSTDAATYRKRGQIYVLTRHYLNAVSDFTRSLELLPSQTDVIVSRGQAYLKSGRPGSAIEDFELALTQNQTYAKAYSGRATALTALNRHEYALIWLTKAIHRFETPREIAEIVFARGKVFYQMGRLGPAIDDFTTVTKLMRQDKKTVCAAKYARGIARYNMGLAEKAARDFRNVLADDPGNDAAAVALYWLGDPDASTKPAFLESPEQVIRPTRPPVVRSPVEMTTRTKDWSAEKPYDTWVLRSIDKKEYGPLQRETLNSWIKEGRVDFGMRLLRADWSKWKRAERIFKELEVGRGEDMSKIEVFPEIELGPPIKKDSSL